MKRVSRTWCHALIAGAVSVSAAVIAATPPAPGAAPAQGALRDPLPALAWLAGDWQMTSGPMQIEEHWLPPVGGNMIGMGRTLKEGQTRFFEFLRIEVRPDGVFYVAQPGGAPPTDFKLTSDPAGLAKEAVFENPAHDFPKRVTYTRNPNGSITARVDGGPSSSVGSEEFRYTKQGRSD